MNNHTPGPWEFVAADNYEVHSRLIPYKFPHNFPEDSTGPFVALIGNHVSDFGEANARLIAAAPDQHDALCSAPILSKYHTSTGFDLEGFVRDYENWSEKKRAAIAKATGQP